MFATGRIVTSVTRFVLNRETLIHAHSTSWSRLNNVRSLALSSQRQTPSKSSKDNEEVNNEPIKFLTSKGSHRTWKVDRSMGSHFQRPWWKVLPVSMLCCGFLVWCILRGETNLDEQLEKHLFEHLPGLQSGEEDGKNKSI